MVYLLYLILTAFIFEFIGIFAFFYLFSLIGFVLYILLHVTSSILLGVFIYVLLKGKYKKNSIIFFTAFFIFSGPIGTFIGIFFYIFLIGKAKLKIDMFESIDEEKFGLEQQKSRPFGEGILTSKFVRPEAVYFLTKNLTPISYLYLKKLLSSQEDEIRLMAFSAISRKENDILELIDELLKELKKDENTNKFVIQFSLAEAYWELVYLDITDKDLESIYLEMAKEYAFKSLKLKKDPKVYHLIGRIYLKENNISEAKRYFELAQQTGFPMVKIGPYLMEIYFKLKQYTDVINIAHQFNETVIPNQKFHSIIEYWKSSNGKNR